MNELSWMNEDEFEKGNELIWLTTYLIVSLATTHFTFIIDS